MFCIGVIRSDGLGWVGNEQGEGASRQSVGSSCNALVQGLGLGGGVTRGGCAPSGKQESGHSRGRPWKAGDWLPERQGENMDHGGHWAKHLGRVILQNPHSPRSRGAHCPFYRAGNRGPERESPA